MSAIWKSPCRPWDQCSDERKEVLRAAWEQGELRWKLDPSQQEIWDSIWASHSTVKSSAERLFCMDVSRQSGKDYIMALAAIVTAIRANRPIRIPYAAPTRETVHELLVPTIETIFQDCPPELLPGEIARGTFRTNAKTLTWPGHRRIVLVGVDLHPDWLRGPSTYAFFFTEPAFVENLQPLIEGVILPMMLTHPEGFGVLGSTPPETPGHPWSTKYIPEAKLRGMYAKRTIDDCPRFDRDQVAGMIRELGGRQATRVRRELYCEHITESTLAIVPEFVDKKAVIEAPADAFANPPEYRDTYVALDPGWEDATGGVFGYFDFHTGLVMIEGDFAVQYQNSADVARIVRAREWQLWGIVPKKPARLTNEAWAQELELSKQHFYPDLPIPKSVVMSYHARQLKPGPYLRISDTNSQLISDLSIEHGLTISPTSKDDTLASMVNAMRLRTQEAVYRIHPRCVHLLADLAQALWNKPRTKFADTSRGHADALAAFMYLLRNVQRNRNPFPPHRVDPRTHHIPPGSSQRTATALSKLFRTGLSKRDKVVR